MKKLLAFTLAETLIVMGIIGIVSALTLPNLNSSTGEKEKVAKVKKLYQNLNDAVGRAAVVYGPLGGWDLDSGNDVFERVGARITEFMKVSKACGSSSSCAKLSNLSNPILTDKKNSFNVFDSYILADGTSLAIVDNGRYSISPYKFISIVIDIDGPSKGSQTVGKDVFEFRMDLSDSANYFEYSPLDFATLSSGDGSSVASWAATWILANDNMEYLKADKNGKCKNGTQLSETVISCK